MDVNCRVPGLALVERTGNSTDVNVGEKAVTVCTGGQGTDPQGWAETLAVDNGRTGEPGVAPCGAVKGFDGIQLGLGIKAKQSCIVGANEDSFMTSQNAGKFDINCRSQRAPGAVGTAAAQRVLTENCETAVCGFVCQVRDALAGHFVSV